MPTRSSRRAHEREEPQLTGSAQEDDSPAARLRSRGPRLARVAAFLVIAAVILGAGTYLAASVFLGPRGTATVAGAIPMRISMDGFDPKVLDAKPGQAITIDWWNTDSPMMLTNGVHTLISDALQVNDALPGNSRKTITLTAPDKPGDYDFWCDSCCGGKAEQKMHGTLHVSA